MKKLLGIIFLTSLVFFLNFDISKADSCASAGGSCVSATSCASIISGNYDCSESQACCADNLSCASAGGSCVSATSCASIISGNYDCSESQACCAKSETEESETETAEDYEEGSTGGFLFLKGHIVPCGRNSDDSGTDNDETASCTLCHLFIMLKNIFDLMFSLVIVAAILFITIGGVLYIVSAGDSSLTSMAKEIIKKTLIGFALMIGGWLIVYTLLTFLSTGDMVGKGSDSWFEFECSTTSNF